MFCEVLCERCVEALVALVLREDFALAGDLGLEVLAVVLTALGLVAVLRAVGDFAVLVDLGEVFDLEVLFTISLL